MNKLIEIYKSIYDAAGLVTTEDGYVSRKVLESVTPFMIEKKRLVLPTDEHLRNPDKENRVLGHFLRENISKGPSEVFDAIRKVMSERLSIVTSLLVLELVELAASPAEHSKLNPDQSEFLSIAKNADEDMTKRIVKLMKAMPINQTQKAFVSLYVKRSANINGKTSRRGGIVTFPLFQELTTQDKEVYGVKLRGKDFETLRAVLTYIYPKIGEVNGYSFGSDSDVAPSAAALMGAVKNVAERIHDILDLFGPLISCADELKINTDWVEAFEDLDSLLPIIRSVPAQLGNEGRSTKTEVAQETALANSKQITAAPQAQAVAPANTSTLGNSILNNPNAVVPSAPAPTQAAPGKVDVSKLMVPGQMPMVMPMQQPMMHPGMMMPQQGMYPGMHPGMQTAIPQGMHPGMMGMHQGHGMPMMPNQHATMPYPGMTGQFGMNTPFGYHPQGAPLHRY